MLCKNKKCNKGNFGKRNKFEQNGTQVYCCTDCLLEDMQTERYKKEVSVKIKKEANEQTKRIKVVVYERENKKYLQNEINKLARMIDARFEYDTCICCHRGFGAQTDGAHYHSVGSNHTLDITCIKYIQHHLTATTFQILIYQDTKTDLLHATE